MMVLAPAHNQTKPLQNRNTGHNKQQSSASRNGGGGGGGRAGWGEKRGNACAARAQPLSQRALGRELHLQLAAQVPVNSAALMGKEGLEIV